MEDKNTTLSWALLLIGGPLMFAFTAWACFRARRLLRRWANENGFRLLAFKAVVSGPREWMWTSSSRQVLYSVRVLDKNGQERRGWVRCGTFWNGIFSDKIEVKWEDQA